MKSDSSIKNICTAAAKRHTIKPIDFALTTLFDNEEAIESLIQVDLKESELRISQTFISELNWTLVTTRRIISSFEGEVQQVFANEIHSWNWGVFKGYNRGQTTVGEIKIDNGSVIKIHIERGKASMIIIYSIMTLVGLVK